MSQEEGMDKVLKIAVSTAVYALICFIAWPLPLALYGAIVIPVGFVYGWFVGDEVAKQ